MYRLTAALALISLASATALAQPDAPPAAPVTRPATVRVTLQTSMGPILLELEKERAPVTTANFLRYVDEKRFDGVSFYRAMKLGEAPLYGLIQGGVQGDPKRALPPIAHEPTSQTGLSHTDGTVSMARGAPGSATGDFFIVVGDLKSLDADPAAPGDNLGFAAFGRVIGGMEVVHRILGAPTSPTAGEGVMKGQMLEPPVRISYARRAE